jgi:lysophospholipase L1-like esterase
MGPTTSPYMLETIRRRRRLPPRTTMSLRRILPRLSFFLAATASGLGALAEDAPLTNRFEKDVLAYEAADKLAAPPHGAILLAGDSQFFRWKTVHEDLAGYTVVNRGIDSFQTSDLVYFTERLVLPHRPRLIIVHVGGNDVHNGKSPEQVLADFQAFVAKVRAVMPEVPIAFSSITPGPGRWSEAPQRKLTNQTVKATIATQPGLFFIDLWDKMLTSDGQPREDLWVEDRVHPNHTGYMLRVKIMRPLLGPPDRPVP